MAPDPVARLRRWFRQAERAGIPLLEAVALATARRDGRPSVRFVLLKQLDRRGLVFFTDARSRKGRELAANPRAALALHWQPLGRQVRVEGRVEPVAPHEADAYWRTRPRGSQLAATVSRQSAPLASRAELVARWRAQVRADRGRPLPRPAAWTGFRLVPDRFEFWTHGEDRLHRREAFRRTRNGWKLQLLQP